MRPVSYTHLIFVKAADDDDPGKRNAHGAVRIDSDRLRKFRMIPYRHEKGIARMNRGGQCRCRECRYECGDECNGRSRSGETVYEHVEQPQSLSLIHI